MDIIRLSITTHHTKPDCNGKPVEYKYSFHNIKELNLVGDNGWVNSGEVLPIPFDLHELQIVGRKINLRGWWTGIAWDGLRITRGMHVKKWK